MFVRPDYAARRPQRCLLRSIHSIRAARRKRTSGIHQPHPRPLRQTRVCIALPHIKAISSLKHSTRAYMPDTLLIQSVLAAVDSI